MLYMVTFTINIPQMLVYIPYMDPMGKDCGVENQFCGGFPSDGIISESHSQQRFFLAQGAGRSTSHGTSTTILDFLCPTKGSITSRG